MPKIKFADWVKFREWQMKTTVLETAEKLLKDIATAEQSRVSAKLILDLIKVELKRIIDEENRLAR